MHTAVHGMHIIISLISVEVNILDYRRIIGVKIITVNVSVYAIYGTCACVLPHSVALVEARTVHVIVCDPDCILLEERRIKLGIQEVSVACMPTK